MSEQTVPKIDVKGQIDKFMILPPQFNDYNLESFLELLGIQLIFLGDTEDGDWLFSFVDDSVSITKKVVNDLINEAKTFGFFE